MAQLEHKFNGLAGSSDCTMVSSGELGTPDQDRKSSPASGKRDASSLSGSHKPKLEQSGVHGRQGTVGWVYFIRCKEGPIKIGWSTRLIERMNVLQGMSPFKLELLAQVRAPKIAERRLHRQFIELRLHGEWFRDDGTISNFVARLQTDGLPDWVTRPAFGRKQPSIEAEEMKRMARECAGPLANGEKVKDQITKVADAFGVSYRCAHSLWYGLGGKVLYKRIAPVYDRIVASRPSLERKGRG